MPLPPVPVPDAGRFPNTPTAGASEVPGLGSGGASKAIVTSWILGSCRFDARANGARDGRGDPDGLDARGSGGVLGVGSGGGAGGGGSGITSNVISFRSSTGRGRDDVPKNQKASSKSR